MDNVDYSLIKHCTDTNCAPFLHHILQLEQELVPKGGDGLNFDTERNAFF